MNFHQFFGQICQNKIAHHEKYFLFLLLHLMINNGNSQNIKNDSIIIGNLKLLISEA